jgi:hypothetical protein
LEATATMLITHKHIFEAMMATSMSLIPKNVVENILNILLFTMNNCMNSYPRAETLNSYKFSRASYWSILRFFIEKREIKSFCMFFSSGLLR